MISRGGKGRPLEIDRLFARHPDIEAALSAGVIGSAAGQRSRVAGSTRRGPPGAT